jgi:hypothetical protein
MPVILWWLLLEGLGLLALPLTFPLFGRRMAHGYPFAKIAALLVLTYIGWLLGFVIPLRSALTVALVGLVVVSLGLAVLQREQLGGWLREGGWRALVRHDGLWTVGFLFFVFQRWMSPDIFGAEKYMDFAFLNGLLRADAMPPPDPWMSGDSINYYYFGYLMFSNLMRLAPLAVVVSYNLCVATIGGLAFAQTAAVVLAITERWGLAVLGGCMSAFLGNLDGFVQFLEKGTLRGMDYWRASRVVAKGDTINEFPFFSTIHGDLHPHFMVLPVSLLLLGILLDERLFPSRPEAQPQNPWRAVVPFALVTFVLGAMVAISNWELPMGVLVVALLAGRWQPLRPLLSRARLQLALRLVGVLVGVYVLFMPFYLNFIPPLVRPGPNEPCIGSACFTLARTSLREFLTVFGFLLFPPAVLLGARAWALVGSRRATEAGADASTRAGSGEGRHLAIAAGPRHGLFGHRRQCGPATARGAARRGTVRRLSRRGRRGPRRLPIDCRRHRGFARLRGGVPEGFVRRQALPDEHRLQALLPGLDHSRRRSAVGARPLAGAALELGTDAARDRRCGGAAGSGLGVLPARHHLRPAGIAVQGARRERVPGARSSGRLRRDPMVAPERRRSTGDPRNDRRSVLVLCPLLGQHRSPDRPRLGEPRGTLARP